MTACNSTFPKHYRVPFLEDRPEETVVRAFYRMSFLEGYFPEISILNSDPGKPDAGFVFPNSMYALTIRSDRDCSEEEFVKTYMKHKMGMFATIALDKEDKHRANFQYAVLPLTPQRWLINNVFDKYTDDRIDEFVRMWEGLCADLI